MPKKINGMTGKEWIASQQGKHFCSCGCGEQIVIKIHHSSRGIPKFIDGHFSRVANPMTGRFGHLNPNYKRGFYRTSNGYEAELIPGPGRSQYKQNHRLIMERHIGRKLARNEVVHHINGDKTDNRIENLELMTNAEHSRLHAINGETGFRKSKWGGATKNCN